MKKIIVLISTLFIVGCEDIQGTLQVFKNFKAHTKNGLQTIKSGSYDTGLEFDRDKVIVTLKIGDNKTEFKINLPRGTEIPNNGNFEIKAAQSGQDFDVLGNNKTIEKRSQTTREWQSCQVQSRPQCGPRGCNYPPPRWGQKYVEYYLRTVTQDIKIDLTAIGNIADKLAEFDGHNSFTQKVILNENQCF